MAIPFLVLLPWTRSRGLQAFLHCRQDSSGSEHLHPCLPVPGWMWRTSPSDAWTRIQVLGHTVSLVLGLDGFSLRAPQPPRALQLCPEFQEIPRGTCWVVTPPWEAESFLQAVLNIRDTKFTCGKLKPVNLAPSELHPQRIASSQICRITSRLLKFQSLKAENNSSWAPFKKPNTSQLLSQRCHKCFKSNFKSNSN